MRKLAFILTILSYVAMAQESDPKQRFIEVIGSSEMEITPDEIFVSITLKEYKRGGGKVTMDELEHGLVKGVKKIGIDEDRLRVQNIYGHNWNWRKKKAEEFLATKAFVLEVNDLKKMNNLIDLLDPEGVNNVNVQSYAHSKIERYRKEVKIGAMKAAREKAAYLLESLGEQLGPVLEVQEIEGAHRSFGNMRSNVAYEMMDATGYESDVEFQKIKLRAEIRVVFAISN